MHSYDKLSQYCVSMAVYSWEKNTNNITEELQTSSRSTLINSLQAIQLSRTIMAVGLFSVFEVMLQRQLSCKDGFLETSKLLVSMGEIDVNKEFLTFQLAINVLKHGEGRSYTALLTQLESFPFKVKSPSEHFFFEGDLGEVKTLIEVTDNFVQACADVIHKVMSKLRDSGKLV